MAYMEFGNRKSISDHYNIIRKPLETIRIPSETIRIPLETIRIPLETIILVVS